MTTGLLIFALTYLLIVGYLEVGKFFEWAAEWVLRRAGSPHRLLLGVVVGGGLLSALFVNDTVCLVVTPVLLAALGPLRVRPTPYLGGLAMTYGCLRWAYRDELRDPFGERLETVPVALDRSLVLKGLAVFGLAVVGWLAGGPLPLVAITAGAAMVAVAHRDPAYAINRVEWSLLLFFGSLFVVMRGFERAVADPWIHAHGLGVALGSAWSLAATLSAVMVLLSNLVSNVPAVMLLRSVIPTLPRADLVWRLVAMSSTFAGNLLLIGSMANLIVAEKAEARGVRIGLGEYARVGVPVAWLTLAWGIVVLVLTR